MGNFACALFYPDEFNTQFRLAEITSTTITRLLVVPYITRNSSILKQGWGELKGKLYLRDLAVWGLETVQ